MIDKIAKRKRSWNQNKRAGISIIKFKDHIIDNPQLKASNKRAGGAMTPKNAKIIFIITINTSPPINNLTNGFSSDNIFLCDYFFVASSPCIDRRLKNDLAIANSEKKPPI